MHFLGRGRGSPQQELEIGKVCCNSLQEKEGKGVKNMRTLRKTKLAKATWYLQTFVKTLLMNLI